MNSETLQIQMNRPIKSPLSQWAKLVFGALVIACLLAFSNLNSGLDDRVYRVLSLLNPLGRTATSHVLIVEIPGGETDDATAILAALRQQNPRRIGFLFLPEDVAAFAAAVGPGVGGASDVVLGLPLQQNLDGHWQVVEPPPQLAAIPTGVVGRASMFDWPERFQLFAYDLAGQRLSAIESILALSPQRQAGGYPLNLFKASPYVPKVAAPVLLQGDVPDSLVTGKTVLVVHAFALEHRAFDAIDVLPGRRLSRAEYHGYALNTLLQGHAVWHMPWWLVAMLLLLVTPCMAALFLRWETATILQAGLVLIGVLLVLAWASLQLTLIWLPVTHLVVQVLVVLTGAIYLKYGDSQRHLRHQILDLATFMQKRFSPSGFIENRKPWELVDRVVHELFPLQSSMMLAQRKGRLQVAATTNCHEADVQERRRDISRDPYSRAIRIKRADTLQRPFFRNKRPDQREFLVPIVFADEVMGFWAFSIQKAFVDRHPNFVGDIQLLAEELAEKFYTRRQTARSAKKQRRKGHFLLAGKDEALDSVLARNIGLLKRYYARLERIFNNVDTNILLYDTFGQILFINDAMSDSLREMGYAAYTGSMHGLIEHLTDGAVSAEKSILRDVMENGEEVTLPITRPDGQSYLFNIQPLTASDQEMETGLFGLLGVLCVMVDMTHVQRINEVKEHIIGNTNQRIRKDLMEISLATDFLEAGDMEGEERTLLLNTIQEKLTDLEDILGETSQFLAKINTQWGDTHHPTDFEQAFDNAMANVAGMRDARKVGFATEAPNLFPFVLASPKILTDILTSLFELYLEDTERGGDIQVRIHEADGFLHMEMESPGYGLPQDRVDRMLATGNVTDISAFKNLQKGVKYVQSWNGSFTLTSTVGKGFRCNLRLQTFG